MEIISFKDAKAANLGFYFTGKPCKRGHIEKRRVTTAGCEECRRIRLREWRAKNPEKTKELDRAWKHKNRDAMNAKNRDAYAKDPEKYRNKTKSYYSKNGEVVRQKQLARHYENYKDPAIRLAAQTRTKEWALANPERAKINAKNAKAKRKNANIVGKFTVEDIKAIMKMQRGKCAYCKIKLGGKYHIDHIIAVARGGSNEPKNLQITCADCNLGKWATDPIIFAQRQGMLL